MGTVRVSVDLELPDDWDDSQTLEAVREWALETVSDSLYDGSLSAEDAQVGFTCETGDGRPGHLHTSSYAVDCDGPIEQTGVDTFRSLAEWIGDEVTMAFARGCDQPTVTGVYDLRATVSYPTDEGGVTVEAVVCGDDCDPSRRTYRDVRAEQAGY